MPKKTNSTAGPTPVSPRAALWLSGWAQDDWIRLASWSAIPALVALYAIYRFGVAIPFLDEVVFALLTWLTKNGQLEWHHLLALHNGHRPFIPRLIALPALLATDYNSRVLMLISWLTIAAILMFLLLMLRRASEGRPVWPVSGLVVSGILFSLCHQATLLDGFQITLALPNFLCVAALYLLTKPAEEANLKRAAGVSLLLWLASASSLNGLCAWPVAFFFACLSMRGSARLRSLLVLAVGFAFSLAFVWPGLAAAAQPANADRTFFHRFPLKAAEFFLAMVGAPFAAGWAGAPEAIAPLIGLVGLAALTLASAWVLWRRHSASYGLVAVIFYGLAAIVATTTGRANWGVAVAATQSRWMCFSILVWAGALLIAAAHLRPNTRGHAWLAASFGFLLAILLLNNATHLPEVRKISAGRQSAAELMRFADALSDQLNGKPASPFWPLFDLPGAAAADSVKVNLRMLSNIGFRPPQVQTPLSLETPRGDGAILAEGTASRLHAGDKLTLRGWAILPKQNRPADYIGISINRTDALFTVFRSQFEDTRWLLREKPGNYAQSGWHCDLPAEYLPKGRLSITAWAFDADSNRFAPLDNTAMPEIWVD